jgi:hypothetical protein
MPSEKVPATTLAEAIARYRERGGNRSVDPRALEHFGAVDVTTIDRDVLLEWGRKLFPKLTIAERMEHFVEPLAEILNLPPAEPGSAAWYAETRVQREAAHERKLDQFLESCPYDARMRAVEETIWAATEAYLDRRLQNIDMSVYTSRDEVNHLMDGLGDWATVLPLKTPGPPPDKSPYTDNSYVAGTSQQCWRWHHRGQLSLLRMDDGTEIHFGYAETPRQDPVYGSIRYDYIGYLHGKPGRPRKAKPLKPAAKIGRPRKLDKESNAEKMKRYRARKKENKSS